MKTLNSRAFAEALLGTALALVLAASAGPAQAAADSNWYSPVSQAEAAGALKLAPAAAAPAATAPKAVQKDVRFLYKKGVQLTHGHAKAPMGIESTPQLVYLGGPMLPNVKVQIVYWNKDVAYQDKLPGFYSTITKSPYFDWLKEYNAGGYSLGEGSYQGAYVDNVAIPQSSQIEDADIQTELTKLIAQKSVPQPDANTLYMFYFPPGLNVDMQGQGSCQVFCAYHNTFTNGGTNVQYGVIPDQGGSCAGGCGADADQFNNETSVSSHEMIESVTDPAVGLATGNTPAAPMAWYDNTYGEIGDICNAVQAQVNGYTVQRVWSNSRNLCVASQQDAGAPYVPAGN